MKLWLKYIKMHRKALFFSLICGIIFGVVLIFYEMPWEVVLYALVVTMTACMGLINMDYWFFTKRHQYMQEMQKYVHLTVDRLPYAHDIQEQDYQDLITALFEKKCEAESEFNKKYQDMVDYYTMWVHQIKTPISAMRLLLQAEPSEEGEELQEQLFKIEQYVEMVLQYMRTEGNGSDLVFRQYSLDKIVRQAVHKYAKSFIRKKIKLEYTELNCIVVTDEKWLVFVVEQLLSNALKYTRTGKISIFMDPEKSLELVIKDTGIGIEQEDLPRIFEKGFTGYNGRTDKKSTGIGLYLCKSILNKLSHRIDIKSEVGTGTEVRLGLEPAELQVD